VFHASESAASSASSRASTNTFWWRWLSFSVISSVKMASRTTPLAITKIPGIVGCR
jgi:hypothetical protein